MEGMEAMDQKRNLMKKFCGIILTGSQYRMGHIFNHNASFYQ